MIHHHLMSGREMLLRFGDCRVSAAMADGSRGCSRGRSARRSAPVSGAQPVGPPVHHVGNAEPPLPATGLGQPDPANVAGPIASRSNACRRRGDERGGVSLRLLHRLPVYSRRSLVAYHIQQRPSPNSPPTPLPPAADRLGRAGDGSCRVPGLRCVQQEGAPAGCVRRTRSLAPLRAVGEGKAQLTMIHLSQSISPLAPPAFAGFIATMRDPTSAGPSAGRRRLLPAYRLRGTLQTSQGKSTWMCCRSRPQYRSDLGWIWASRSLAR